MSSRIIQIILVSFTAVLIIGISRGKTGIKDFFTLRQSRDVLANAVNKLDLENKTLKDEVMKIKKSKSYARKILRDKYHVVDSDETIVFFPD